MSVQETGPMPAPEPETVAAFLGRLHQRGVQLWVAGEPGRERLRVQAPAGALSVDDRRRLAQAKDAIIAALLAAGAGAGTDTDTDTDGAPPVDTDTDAATTTAADGKPVRKIGFIGKIPAPGAEAAGEGTPESGEGVGACPRCRALEAQAVEVLAELKARSALPPALRALPDDRLLILLRWTFVGLANPRPQWPPRPPTAAQRKHRPGLDGLIESLGGRPLGAEPPPPEELDDGAITD
jgi:hypothetical protein